MQFKTATPEQIDLFVKAAMDRYNELGIPEEQATQLMQNEIMKAAVDLGMIQPPEQPTQKTAADEMVDVAIKHLMKTAGMTEDQAVDHLDKHLKKQERVAAFKVKVATALKKEGYTAVPPQMAGGVGQQTQPGANVLSPQQQLTPPEQKNPIANPVKPATPPVPAAGLKSPVPTAANAANKPPQAPSAPLTANK